MTQIVPDTIQLVATLRPFQDEIEQAQADYTAFVAELDKNRIVKRIDADNLRLDFTTIQQQVQSLAEELTDLRDDLDDLGKLPAVGTVANSLILTLPEWHAHIDTLKSDFDALKTLIRADEAIAKYLDNGGRRGIFSRKPDLDDALIMQFTSFDQSLVDALAGLATFETDQLPTLIEQTKTGVDADYEAQIAHAETEMHAKMDAIHARATAVFDDLGAVAREWQQALWESFIRKPTRPTTFPDVIRLGKYLGDDAQGATVPMLIPFQTDKHLIIVANTDQFAKAQALLQSIIMRLLLTVPSGTAKFTLIDVTENTLSFAKRLPKSFGGGGLLRDADEINDGLQEALHHIRQYSQEHLGIVYKTLTAYNAQAKIFVPYHMICVADLSNGLNPKAQERLATLIERGSKAGVLLLAVVDKANRSVDLSALMRESVVISADSTGFSVGDMRFEPDSLPDKTLLGNLLAGLKD
ncbi:MAG: hypothetical protein SH821_16375 [Phototrophicales bacterium]|nr:hypothetical protein [Phototrophicales bacterium]